MREYRTYIESCLHFNSEWICLWNCKCIMKETAMINLFNIYTSFNILCIDFSGHASAYYLIDNIIIVVSKDGEQIKFVLQKVIYLSRRLVRWRRRPGLADSPRKHGTQRRHRKSQQKNVWTNKTSHRLSRCFLLWVDLPFTYLFIWSYHSWLCTSEKKTIVK